MPQAKKQKRPDTRPARARYWANRTLQKRKVRNLVRHCRMNPADALEHWLRARQGRVKGRTADLIQQARRI